MMEQWVLEKWNNDLSEEFSLSAKRIMGLHPSRCLAKRSLLGIIFEARKSL
jgi:hypothetical protein